jgi:hypothetical protein
MKCFAIYLFALFSLGAGCDLRTREEDLKKREIALAQKEQELLLKEKTLQIKEDELINREQKTDTSSTVDTTKLYNPAIIGIWSVKMTCTETTCAGSAVGDTKTEQWNISYEANAIIAKAMSDEKLVRTYTGVPKGDVIELAEQPQNVISQPLTTMVVRLRLTNINTMEGQREIIRDNCKVTYALQMVK